MSVFFSERDLAVPKSVGWLWAASMDSPTDEPYYEYLTQFWFHPRDSYRRGTIIDQHAATAYGWSEDDDVEITVRGRKGGWYRLKTRIGLVLDQYMPLPFVWVTEDHLTPHFDFSPDDPLKSDLVVELHVHARRKQFCSYA
jgi:hypothetical protein